ncbi:histidine-containing phosphotransfer protein 1-like isoform X2 [Actinidia eriantha]|uniref:histidine-containing phosphotransfer protein 1-like isoform X2 n=1 Tax=Actinidia eriantha TaxID=165200 RepID=UPI00258C5367|nr:histidine-containing phosphotransfer protein 1-like isoform X2 [Actinidia eriantha]
MRCFLMISSHNFSNCKMRAIQTLWLKWSLSSLKTLRGFSLNSPKLCEENLPIWDQQCVDFRKVDAYVHQLKGSSSSIGAQRVQRVCIYFRNYCDEQNVEGCLKCLQQVKNEYTLVKNKLETLFKFEQQLLAAGGSIPMQ